jgi:Ni,Fe-hydrogenase I large subunit
MLEKELNKEINELNKNLSDVDEKKSRLYQESKVMQSSAADEESKKIDPKDYKEIEELITELYYSSGTGERGGNPKMGNAGVI